MRQSSIVLASVFTCSGSEKWRHSSLVQRSALLPPSKRGMGSSPSRVSSWVCVFCHCVGSPGPLASSHRLKLTSGVNGCLSWTWRWDTRPARGSGLGRWQLAAAQGPVLPTPSPPPAQNLHSFFTPHFLFFLFPLPAIIYWLMSAPSSHHNFAAVCIPPPPFSVVLGVMEESEESAVSALLYLCCSERWSEWD